jgi:hypothetical protein
MENTLFKKILQNFFSTVILLIFRNKVDCLTLLSNLLWVRAGAYPKGEYLKGASFG